MNYRTIVFLFAVAFTVSCSNNLSQSDYVSWVEDTDNGLRIERVTSSAEYTLQYEPSLYKALSLSEGKKNSTLARTANQYKNMHHFILRIKPALEAFSDKKEMSNFLAYELKEKVRFVEGSDTLDRTVMYHLESTGGIMPFQSILMAFPKTESNKPLTLFIEPNKLEPQKQEFYFRKESLRELKTITRRIE